MIQTQGAVVTHVIADEAHKALQTLRFHDDRILWRNAPALAPQRQGVRRCTDLCAHAIAGPIAPGLRTGGIGAHRIVPIQPDGHIKLARQRLGALQLFMSQPLQIKIKIDLQRMSRCELASCRAIHIAIFAGPAQPARRRGQRRAEILIQGVETRMRLEQRTTGGDESAKFLRSCASRIQMAVTEIPEQQFENFELDVGDASIID